MHHTTSPAEPPLRPFTDSRKVRQDYILLHHMGTRCAQREGKRGGGGSSSGLTRSLCITSSEKPNGNALFVAQPFATV